MGQPGVYVPIDKRVLEHLYWDRGLSIPEVADELGVSLMTVHISIPDDPRRREPMT